MPHPTRRQTVASLLSLAAVAPEAIAPAGAQQNAAPPMSPFRFEDVVRRARDIAGAPFDAGLPPLPAPIANLDFDAYRDIRFKPERALLAGGNSPFRLQLFHLGFLYTRPVVVNVIRDGVATPIPYQSQLFDYGRTKIERPLPVNLGFAGFRLHYPLNDPRIFDELIAFLGASYFRFLGRDQRYGASVRGLSIGAGGSEEEFPFFREFGIDTPTAGAERISVYALLDGPSVVGAYRFDIYPAAESFIEVALTLFPRKPIQSVGMAPLTSMFFTGENDRRTGDDFRPELHDSDGLLLHLSSGEWVWRALRNPKKLAMTGFGDTNLRGFGLMQRDRLFEHYQDLEAYYHQRPSYWIEPTSHWGEGRVELVELPTDAEVHDNIVAFWTPKQPMEPGQDIQFGYRIRALNEGSDLHPGGKVINTFHAPARASGSPEPSDPTARRFLIDFAGGNLAYYLPDPAQVQVVPSTSSGRIVSTSVIPNEHTGGFRATIDVKLEAGQPTDLRAFLRAGSRTLTETWLYTWTAG